MASRSMALHLLLGGILCVLMSSTTALGQDSRSELPPEKFAEFLLDTYDVVALGEFLVIPDHAASDFSREGPKEVVLELEVSSVYQGYVVYDRIAVRVAADMLLYPGESIARYQKRVEVRQRRGARLRELEQEDRSNRSHDVL